MVLVPRDSEPVIRRAPPVGSSFGPLSRTARPAELAFIEKGRASETGGAPPKPRKRALVTLGATMGFVAAALLFALPRETPSQPKPVSGAAAPRRTQSGAEERWTARRVRVVLDESLDDRGLSGREVVANAFGAWLSAVPDLPHMSFDSRAAERVVLEPDGENRIYYAPIPVRGHERDLGLTVAHARPDTGEIFETDVIINSRTKLTASPDEKANDDEGRPSGPSERLGSLPAASGSSCDGGYDLQSIVTHEIGHFFGLSEDFTNQDATMYYSTSPCETKQRDVTTVDALEMTRLYAPVNPPATAATAEQEPRKYGACNTVRRSPSHAAALEIASVLAFAGASRLRRSSSRRRRR